MSVLTGPLLSLGARGQIGKSIVFAEWKGVPYARQYVVPANPKTAPQIATRSIMKFLSAAYPRLPALVTAGYDAFVSGKPLTTRNQFIRANMALLIGDANLNNMQIAQAAGGAPDTIPSNFSATAGAGTITFAPTLNAIPAGWTVQAVVGAVIRDGDPDTYNFTLPGVLFSAGEDTSAAYSIVLAGLAAGVPYQWSCFTRMVAPDLSVRFSIEHRGQATPS